MLAQPKQHNSTQLFSNLNFDEILTSSEQQQTTIIHSLEFALIPQNQPEQQLKEDFVQLLGNDKNNQVSMKDGYLQQKIVFRLEDNNQNFIGQDKNQIQEIEKIMQKKDSYESQEQLQGVVNIGMDYFQSQIEEEEENQQQQLQGQELQEEEEKIDLELCVLPKKQVSLDTENETQQQQYQFQQTQIQQAFQDYQERERQNPNIKLEEYQQNISDLQNQIWQMEQERIYSDQNGLSKQFQRQIKTNIVGQSSQSCSICYQNLEKGQTIKRLPCKHIFHGECIKPWLNKNVQCPNCRFNLKEYYETHTYSEDQDKTSVFDIQQ